MDIAKIGIEVNTSDVEQAVVRLNKMKAAASGVTDSTNKVTAAAVTGSRALSNASLAVAKAVTAQANANLKAVQASSKATKADLQQAKQALATARAHEQSEKSILAAAKAQQALERAARSTTQAQIRQNTLGTNFNNVGQVAAGGGMQSSTVGRIGAANTARIANDQLPNRFNTANIAAQFQDIGVTAAAGFNPFTVALQQGTQISAILNSMESPLKGIAIAFRSIINPVSLMSIALTGLAVVGIQMVDWVKVGKSILMSFADAVDTLTPALLSGSAALALWYSPQILLSLWGAVTATYAFARSMVVATASIVSARVAALGFVGFIASAIPLAIVAATAAVFAFREDIAQALGFDIVSVAASGVNKIVGIFIGGLKAIRESIYLLDDVMMSVLIDMVNGVTSQVDKMINVFINGINSLTSFTGVQIQPFVSLGPVENTYREQAARLGVIMRETISKEMNKDFVGDIGKSVTGFASKIRNFATNLGGESDDEKKQKEVGKLREAYEDLVSSSERRIASLKVEQQSLGLTAEAALRLKNEQDLLNQAAQKGIELTPSQREQLSQLAGQMTDLETQTDKARTALEFNRETTKSFVNDLRSGLEEGKSIWASFADAVINALDSVLDKMVEASVEGLFNPDSGGSSGGFLNSILGSFGSIFGGGSGASQAAARGAANPALYGPGFAKGGAFDNGVQAFAKGGAFTNGVYSSPTMFKFGQGGSFGVMGEAGPEAVMPLHRGSDGSLGVKMAGQGGNSTSNVYNIDARNAQPGVEKQIKLALSEIDRLRKDSPNIAINSVVKANKRTIGLLS